MAATLSTTGRAVTPPFVRIIPWLPPVVRPTTTTGAKSFCVVPSHLTRVEVRPLSVAEGISPVSQASGKFRAVAVALIAPACALAPVIMTINAGRIAQVSSTRSCCHYRWAALGANYLPTMMTNSN